MQRVHYGCVEVTEGVHVAKRNTGSLARRLERPVADVVQVRNKAQAICVILSGSFAGRERLTSFRVLAKSNARVDRS